MCMVFSSLLLRWQPWCDQTLYGNLPCWTGDLQPKGQTC